MARIDPILIGQLTITQFLDSERLRITDLHYIFEPFISFQREPVKGGSSPKHYGCLCCNLPSTKSLSLKSLHLFLRFNFRGFGHDPPTDFFLSPPLWFMIQMPGRRKTEKKLREWHIKLSNGLITSLGALGGWLGQRTHLWLERKIMGALQSRCNFHNDSRRT